MHPEHPCTKPRFGKTETHRPTYLNYFLYAVILASMNKSDLYALVKSLTLAERKAFSKRHAGSKSGNFMRLFNAIANGDVNDDTQARKVFSKEKFASHLHKTKAYLYEAVLDTLLPPMQDNFKRLQVLKKIEYAEIFISRKLFEQAETLLKDALTLVMATEEMELQMLLHNMLSSLHATTNQPQHVLNDTEMLQQKMQEYLKYHQLFYTIHNTYTSRGKKGAEGIEHFLEHPLLKPDKQLLSKRAERHLELSQSLVLTVNRNYKSAMVSNKKIVAFLEPLHTVATLGEIAYVNALFNAGMALQNLQTSDPVLTKKLEDFAPKSRWAKSHRFVCLLRLKLNSYVSGRQSAEGKKLIAWIEHELPLYRNDLNELELIKLHSSIAGLYLKEKNYARALDYLLLIIHSKTARESRAITYRVTTLYQLIAYYELQDFELLANLLRNYKYFQKTNDSFYLIEKHTLGFLNRALQLSDKKARNEAKTKFEKELFATSGKEHKSGLIYLQNIGWVKP